MTAMTAGLMPELSSSPAWMARRGSLVGGAVAGALTVCVVVAVAAGLVEVNWSDHSPAAGSARTASYSPASTRLNAVGPTCAPPGPVAVTITAASLAG
jgi:hypothetical protein